MAPIARYLSLALALSFVGSTIAAPARLPARQLAGEGNAADSILTSTDNGVGYGTENAEDNTANLITSSGVKLPTRQADKIANGASNVLNAAGAPAAASAVKSNGDTVDGQLTDDATNDGAAAGSAEETTLEQAGSDVP